MEASQSADDLDVGEGPCTRAPVKSANFSATRDLMNIFGPSWRTRSSTDCSVQHGVRSPKAFRGSPKKMADLQVQAMDLSRQSRQRSHTDVGNMDCIIAGSSMEVSTQHVHTGTDAGDLTETGIAAYSPATKFIGGSATELSREETCLREDSSLNNETSSLLNLQQVIDERIEVLGRKLIKDVEDRLSSWEESTRQRLSEASDFSSAMSEQLSAMGGQLVAFGERISKISNRPSTQLSALEERVIALDRSLSELRCEYLEGCLRSHQMEELLIALHSNVREIRTSQVEPKQQMSLPGVQGRGNTRSEERNMQGGSALATGQDRVGWPPKKRSQRAPASPHSTIRGATSPRLETISEVQGDANIVDYNSDNPGNHGCPNDERYQELMHQGPASNEQKAERQLVDNAEPEAKLGAEVLTKTKDVALILATEAFSDGTSTQQSKACAGN